MTVETIDMAGAPVRVEAFGAAATDRPHLVFAHGWGQSGAAMRPLAESLARHGAASVVDFPGFGASPLPPADWGTADYADAVAGWLSGVPRSRRIWIGHSFGCRVGLQIAARHPGLVDALCLVAGAGLRRQRPLLQRAKLWLKVRAFKLAKLAVPEGPARDRLRARFGSADYAAAGGLRGILVKVTSEDLTEVARRVRVPTLLVYGEADTETPPETGRRLAALIPGAKLVVLPHEDHYTVLGTARQQTLYQIQSFLKDKGLLA